MWMERKSLGMSEDKQIFFEDVGGDFGFRLKWTWSDSWCDVEAWAIKRHEMPDMKPLFESSFCGEHLPFSEEFPNYLKGFVKWDGCSEFEFPRHHFCGPIHYLKHFAVLKYIYQRAMELMNSTEEPWPNVPPQSTA